MVLHAASLGEEREANYVFHIPVIYLFIHTTYVYWSTLSVRATTLTPPKLNLNLFYCFPNPFICSVAFIKTGGIVTHKVVQDRNLQLIFNSFSPPHFQI